MCYRECIYDNQKPQTSLLPPKASAWGPLGLGAQQAGPGVS